MAEKCRPAPKRRQPLILNHPLGELAEPPVTVRALSMEIEVIAQHAPCHGLLDTFGNISNISATQQHFFTCFWALLDELTVQELKRGSNPLTSAASCEQHHMHGKRSAALIHREDKLLSSSSFNQLWRMAQVNNSFGLSYFLFAHTTVTVQITWLQRGQLLLYFLENQPPQVNTKNFWSLGKWLK